MELSRLYDRQRSGGLWAVLSGGGRSAVAFFNFVVLSRLIGPEGFGLMAMVDACLALGLLVLRNSASDALVQDDLEDDAADTMFWTLQAAALAAVGLVYLSRGLVEAYFGYEELPALLLATSAILPLTALSATSRALLTRDLRLDRIGRVELLAELIGGALGLVLAWMGYGVWSLVVRQVAARVIECAGLTLAEDWRPRLRWSARTLAGLSRFSGPHAGLIAVGYLERQAPRFLLGGLYGAAEVGYFHFAIRVAGLCEKLLLGPVRWLAMPSFAQLRSREDDLRDYYRAGVSMTSTLVFPFFAGIALSAGIVIPALLGEQWAPGVLPLQILSVSSMRLVFSAWNTALMRGLGRQGLMLLLGTARTALALGLMVLWIDQGAAGLAAAILAANYLAWPMTAWAAAKLSGLTWEQIRPVWPAFAAMLAMAGALLSLDGTIRTLPPLVGSAVFVGLGVVVYFGVLRALGGDRVRLLLEVARGAFPDGLQRRAAGRRA